MIVFFLKKTTYNYIIIIIAKDYYLIKTKYLNITPPIIMIITLLYKGNDRFITTNWLITI